MTNAIEIRHVGKRFGDVRALRDVTMSVPRGTTFGFLGPNGAGKTTTLRGLMGLIRFDAGSSTVLGMDPWRERVPLHAKIGYLPSDMGMHPRMRGIDVLEHAADLTSGPDAASPLRATVLDALRLSDRDLRRPVRDYSKGMRQKVAITQALQHDPDLLLMDEPSEGLDPLVQHALYALLRDRAAAGRTVVFSSHTLSEVQALCEHVAFIRDGEIVAQGPLEELRQARSRVVRIVPRDPAQLDALGPGFVRVADDPAGNAVFHVAEEPDAIVAVLSRVQLHALLIEEPSLDDIFRSYYSGEAADGGLT